MIDENATESQNSDLKTKDCCFFCKRWVQQLGLFLLVFLVYGRTLSFDFVYDDFLTVLDNPAITSLKNVRDFFFDRNSTATPASPLAHEIYRPLKTLSVALDHALYGFNPAGYHATNLLLHAWVGILLFQILELLGFAPWLRLFWSAIFLIHPALFENVSYVSARADILSALFLLLAFKTNFFLRNATPLKAQRQPMVFFFLACLAKETAVMYPLFLLGFLGFQKVSLQKALPYWILAAAYLCLRQSVILDFAQTEPFMDSVWLTQATMLKTWVLYLTGFLWPLRLDILPAILLESECLNPRTLASLAFLSVFTFFLFRKRKSLGLAGIGFWWFFVFLLPVANFVPIKAFMAWRFVYISWIGLVLAACFLFSKIPLRPPLKVLLLCWSLALAFQTLRVSSAFASSETLWKPLIERYPRLAKPYRELAWAYFRENRVNSAQAVIETGLKALPKDNYLLSDFAKTCIALKNYPKALETLQKVDSQTQKELGEGFLFDWVFVCYQSGHFPEILQTLSWIPPKELSVKTLLLQAHGCVLAGANQAAKRLYDELLMRQLDPTVRHDCETIYGLLEHAGKA